MTATKAAYLLDAGMFGFSLNGKKNFGENKRREGVRMKEWSVDTRACTWLGNTGMD